MSSSSSSSITYTGGFLKPTNQQHREFGHIQVSSIVNPTNPTVAILPMASSVDGGSASSYYLIWGFGAATSGVVDGNAFLGVIVDMGNPAGHAENATAGPAVLHLLTASDTGPVNINFPIPIKLTPGGTIGVDSYGGASPNHTCVYVQYSLVL